MKLARTLLMTALLLYAAAAAQAAAPDATHAGRKESAANTMPKPPRAKTKAESDAYQASASLSEPAASEAAATAFAQRYPASELRSFLFQRAMGLYQQASNPAKTLEMARAVLKYDPNNSAALLGAAQVLAEHTYNEDLDRDERLKEAAAEAQAALQHSGELMQPAGVTAAQFADAIAELRSQAHEVLADVAYKRHDYRQAVTEYNAATEMQKDPVAAIVWLRMAAAYDKLNEYSQGIGAAEKAIAASQTGSAVRELAEKEIARLKARATAALQLPSHSPEAPAAPVRAQ